MLAHLLTYILNANIKQLVICDLTWNEVADFLRELGLATSWGTSQTQPGKQCFKGEAYSRWRHIFSNLSAGLRNKLMTLIPTSSLPKLRSWWKWDGRQILWTHISSAGSKKMFWEVSQVWGQNFGAQAAGQLWWTHRSPYQMRASLQKASLYISCRHLDPSLSQSGEHPSKAHPAHSLFFYLFSCSS